MSDHQGDSNDQNFDESELQEIMNEIEDLEREVSSNDSEDAPEEQLVDSPQAKDEEPSEQPESEEDAEDKNLQSEIDREMEEAQQQFEEESQTDAEPEMVEGPKAQEEPHHHEESPEEMRSQMEVVSDEEDSSDEEPAIDFDEEELRALEEDDEEHSDSSTNVSSFKKPRGAEPVHGEHGENSPVHFHAHGDMGVNLTFQVGEEHAYLSIEQGPSGKQGLRVQMGGVDLFLDDEEGCRVELEGGARFTVPVSMKKGQKKAS